MTRTSDSVATFTTRPGSGASYALHLGAAEIEKANEAPRDSPGPSCCAIMLEALGLFLGRGYAAKVVHGSHSNHK